MCHWEAPAFCGSFGPRLLESGSRTFNYTKVRSLEQNIVQVKQVNSEHHSAQVNTGYGKTKMSMGITPPSTIPAMASAKSWLIKPTLPQCITYPASSEPPQPKVSHTRALIMGITPPSDNVGYDTR